MKTNAKRKLTNETRKKNKINCVNKLFSILILKLNNYTIEREIDTRASEEQPTIIITTPSCLKTLLIHNIYIS